ncbi:protein spire homolog 1 isoform X3 [Electrophorus electricus]|uniref:protein spire homolog 1 isoform X3 n=1 Tax=Electrophorus electricus TaxID=8005 RepID=UPI0015CFADFF|nr:protein spire homolog 1 isoform X3 [Electrophorus electricus]
MERNGSAPGACQISLSDILALQGRPACEEEAWALCYQLCSLLEPGSWKTLRVPGPDGVLFSSDGRVTLRTDGGETGEQFVIETEDQTVDYVGRLVYSCLDWGLGADVERELNETLELLVCQMTKVNISLGAEHCLQPVCSISEVLQEFAWKNLVEEFSRGVVLRPLKASLSTSARPPADRSPFNQLLQDIQRRRYSLRKVPAVGHGQRRVDPHQALLEVIRSGPKLRPVSERSLKPRTQNPEQETSLHELLMREIRSVDPVKLLSSHKRRQSCKVHSCSHVNSLMTICEDSTNEEASFILNPVPHPSHQGVPAQGGECKGVIPQQDSFTGSADGYLKFFPALSSTPQNPSLGCRLSHRKRRARSFASCRDLCQLAPKSRACVPMTIADVINMHYAKEGKLKTMACEVNWRVCSCCKKKSVYFTWHMVCSLCSRIVCPECCVEMRLPFKWCVNLPLSFFKKIVLNKESKRSQRKFWNERWSWDPLWVPLVLESPVPTSAGPHSLAMRGWHSQAVCIGCKGLLLQALDSVLSRYPIRNHQEV